MLDDSYEPLSIEKKWQSEWELKNQFKPVESDKQFSIVIPPPNVTGSLHMGHALEHSIIDVIVRIKRLQGFETLWVPGTDHAGIITQLLVENELSEKGLTKEDVGRENFISKVWEWKEASGENISSQQVEKVLMENEGVAEVSVVGVPDDKWGEVPKAFVTIREGAALTEEELIEFAKGSTLFLKVSP